MTKAYSAPATSAGFTWEARPPERLLVLAGITSLIAERNP
jgi:hypothetical protein